MPIDTSPYGRTDTPDAGNLLQAMAAGQQIRQQQSVNRLQALQAQQAQAAIGDDQRLREAIKNNTKNGATDYPGVIGYLAQNGGGTQIPGVIKMQQDAIKQRADLMTSALRLQKDQSTQVMANPTLANANASLDRMESIFGPGSMSAERQALTAMGDDPQKIHAWAAGHGVDADKLLPQFTSRDIGGSVQSISRNPVTGQEQVIGTTNKTMTPAEVAAQQNAAKARELQAQSLAIDKQRLQQQAQQDSPEYKAKVVAATEAVKDSIQRQQAARDASNNATQGLSLIADMRALVPQSSDSMIGRSVRAAGAAFGMGSDTRVADAKLETMGNQLALFAQRFPGVQTDKDYERMMAQVGVLSRQNATQEEKLAALDAAERFFRWW